VGRLRTSGQACTASQPGRGSRKSTGRFLEQLRARAPERYASATASIATQMGPSEPDSWITVIKYGRIGRQEGAPRGDFVAGVTFAKGGNVGSSESPRVRTSPPFHAEIPRTPAAPLLAADFDVLYPYQLVPAHPTTHLRGRIEAVADAQRSGARHELLEERR